MKIELKKLTLLNFKGAAKQEVEFSDRTSILGQNASGKTRLWDAWCFLLFGKDSQDKNDFSIKSLDKDNNPLHRADHSVTGELVIDGRRTKLERTYREKWVKKRGEETPEFTGHETVYFVDSVPYQAGEYAKRIESYLPELLFKQITNPLYFNSMHWERRREMLFDMAGNLKDSDIIEANPELRSLLDHIIEGQKSLEDFKKELSAKKKMLRDELLDIPARIDEVNRAIVPEPDVTKLEKEIKEAQTRLTEIDNIKSSEAEKFNIANRENQEKQNRAFLLKQRISKLEFDDREKAGEAVRIATHNQTSLESQIQMLTGKVREITFWMQSKSVEKKDFEQKNQNLRLKWNEINGSSLVFNENEFVCPACSRPFEIDDIETRRAEMTAHFNTEKLARLEAITKEGKGNNEQIENINQEIKKLQETLDITNRDIQTKQTELNAIVIPEQEVITLNPEIRKLKDEVAELEKSITTLAPPDYKELIDEYNKISASLDELKSQRGIKESNDRHRDRITQLHAREKEVSQQIADLEKMFFICENFTKAKVRMVEDRINSMFSIVRFKMFKTLINGATEETCETLINGVPYQDANAAARIQGGLDIIAALSKHYDVYAPIWIDNRESTTNIPEMDCQVISLIVDPRHKALTIKNAVASEEAATMKN